MDEKTSEAPGSEELDLVHEWMTSVGGSILLGDSKLKSAEVSKRGDKLTIILKKKAKQPKTDQEAKPQPWSM